MALPAEQVDALRRIYPELSAGIEGGTEFIRIDKLKLPEPCLPREVTGLLCPSSRDGYPSRLYLSEMVTHPGKANWNPATGSVIFGAVWWSLSWTTKSGQTLVQLVIDHLKAFQP